MKGNKKAFTRKALTTRTHHFTVAAIVLISVAAALVISACTQIESIPPPTPSSAAISMKFGERYHEIHTNKLQLKCDFCHTNSTETYYDPLAQVSNLADRRACLSCHKEGVAQPFYGEAWSQAKVK